jgi:organic hydroperoxide reductase OsmC/OhrA
MIQYPLKFEVSIEGKAGMEHSWKTRVPGHKSGEVREVVAAVPPEFEGPGGGFSPEDFYALALLNCFTATFQVIATRSKLEFSAFAASGTLVVDRDEKGAPWMKHFHLRAKVEGAKDPERAKRLLEKTSQSCLILNSVRTEKTFEFEA